MASGVPCVTTDAGDARIIVGPTGTVVAAGDSLAVAQGVLELMAASAEERAALSARCRARIAQTFEIGGVVGRYAEFYRGLNEDFNRQRQREQG